MSVVAAFDFDGTLCRGDSLLPFLRRVAGRPALVLGMGRMVRAGVDRNAMKERLVGVLLRGRRAEDVDRAGDAFARELEARLRPDVMAQLRRHRDAGHTIVLVSASLTTYLQPFARNVGIDHVCATELEVVDGVVTGRFRGGNCRGPEKLVRLEPFLAGASTVFAYGNSSGDAELLARADVACHVKRDVLPAVEAGAPGPTA